MCVASGGDYFPFPFWSAPISLSVGGEVASGVSPRSTKASKQNTMSPNCESWNYLWTWPLQSQPQTSLITFGDLCTGYHGDENNIWNSSLLYCASAAGMGKQMIMTITKIMPKTHIRSVWRAGSLIKHTKLLLSFLSPAGNKIWKESSCSIFSVPVQSESLPIQLPFRKSPHQNANYFLDASIWGINIHPPRNKSWKCKLFPLQIHTSIAGIRLDVPLFRSDFIK